MAGIWHPDGATPGTPYWWEGRRPIEGLTQSPPQSVDLLIVGAGYTGLSAALTAADCGASVVVVDAGQPGNGASSRNGGMMGAHPRFAYETMVERFGQAAADQLYDEAPAAFAHTRDLITRENIDCDFEVTGRIQLAWTDNHFADQARLARALANTSPGTAELVAPDQLSSHINTRLYKGGLYFPGHGSLHPRKFHDGLLRAVLRRGVPVVAGCRIDGLQRTRTGFLAETAKGVIRAERVLMATNGYTAGRFGWLRKRVFPLPSFMIATEALPADLIRHLAPGRRMMVETRARHSYFRISPDGTRLLFGGRASMRPISPERAAARLHASMCGIWPELNGTRITHSWSGNTGYAFGHMPHLGRHDGVHHAMGYSGSGVAVSPYLGMKVAYLMLDDPRGATAYQATTFKTHPLHPFQTPHFLRAADLWYRFAVDPAQNMAKGPDRGQ